MKKITRIVSAVLSTALLASVVTVAPFSVSAAEIQNNDEANTTTFESDVEFVVNGTDSTESQENTNISSDTTALLDNTFELTQGGKNVQPVGESIIYICGKYSYTLNDNNEATITKYTGTDEEVVIPSLLNNYTVISIDTNVFIGNSFLKKITIPNTITSVGCDSYYNKGPFTNCSNLKTVVFESGIECIPAYVMAQCPALETIIIPDTVKDIGFHAFYKCTSLKEITIPKSIQNVGKDTYYTEGPFNQCTNLKKVVFEEGTSIVPAYIFSKCSGLETVSMPDTVKTIENYAFYSCSSIRSIQLPSSLESLGLSFIGCNGLDAITIPNTVTSVGCDTFYKKGPFSNCSNLKTVVFEGGTSIVPAYIFSQCSGLETVSLPDTVKSINGYSFANCENLERVYLSDNIETISNSAFQNSSNVTIFCPKYSKIMIMLVNQQINCVSSDDKRILSTEVIDEANSQYSIISSANLSASCSYKIKDEIFGKAKNTSIKIFIPTGAEIIDGTLYLNKDLCTNYSIKDNYLSIPVSTKSGKISFQIDITGDCKLQTYAILNYTLDGKTDYDIIDVINEDVDLISLSSDDVTSYNKLKISGIAPVDKDVDIYIDDEIAATLKANKVGNYSGEVTIPNAEDGKSYVVKAVSIDNNGNEITASKPVLYQENAPELTEFTMTYNGKTYDLMSGKKQSITFIPSKFIFTFKAKYSNAENIKTVYITSTRNQVTKKLKATYDDNTGYYIYKGCFDENDHRYVPGRINITYTPQPDESKIQSALEENLNMSYDDLSDEWKNADITVVKDTEDEFEAEIKLSDDKIITYSQNNNLSLEDLNRFYFPEEYKESSGNDKNTNSVGAGDAALSTVTEFFKKLGKKFGSNAIQSTADTYHQTGEMPSITIKDDNKKSFVTIIWDSAKDAFISTGTSYVGTYFIQENSIGASWAESASAWSLIYGIGKPVYDFAITDQKKIDDAQADIYNSTTLTAEQKEYAIEKTKQVEWAYAGLAGARIATVLLNSYISAHCGPLGPPVNTLLNLLSGMAFNIIEDHLDASLEHFKSGGKGSIFNWSIDPSGYVYAAVTSNRIEGATVTAYWIPFDEEDETYWDNPDETKAVVWDSDEYSQYNPLTTDADGNYAWDVPEGWWKVKVEKEGYETYTSEWLPVPPPQTDVNINLLNKSVPQITNATVDGSTITLEFSEYMNPDTLHNIMVKDYKGNDVTYMLTYSEDETSYEGSVYAKEFCLVFDESYKPSMDYYTVEIDGAKSYADVEYTGTSKVGEFPFRIGDTNLDGKITISDVTAIQRHIAELELFSEEQIILADTNGDGKVDIGDATHLQKYLAEFDGIVLGKTHTI